MQGNLASRACRSSVARTVVVAGLAGLAGLAAGCTDEPLSFGDDVTNPDIPPRGEGDIAGWIAAGHYLTWKCEPAPVDVRFGSPHRPQTRTCNNSLVATVPTGEFATDSASVKEMYNPAGEIMGFGVSRKFAPGGADGWYWYEKLNGDVKADGMGAPAGSCSGCHADATRDFIYVIVP